MGLRLPFQIPHDTPEDCREPGLTQRTTAELIRSLPLPAGARLNPEPKRATSKLALRASFEMPSKVVERETNGRERESLGVDELVQTEEDLTEVDQ